MGDILPAEQPRVQPVEETRLMPSDPEIMPPVAEDRPVDLDATIAFDPSTATDLEQMKQVGHQDRTFHAATRD
jgi:hypothetical protein